MSKKKKKRNNTGYFTKKHDDAIIEYNNTDSQARRNKLYNEFIYPALDKLAENIINNNDFNRFPTTFEDLKLDTVTFMTTKLDRFDPSQGKGFSYFNIVGYRYLIKRDNDYRDYHINRQELISLDYERDIPNEIGREHHKEMLESFMYVWSEWLEYYRDDLFNSKRDKMILDALLILFRDPEDIDIYNKKLFYILVKEFGVGINTQNITKVVNKLRDMFYDQFEHYRIHGNILTEPYI